nr:MAG TPA: hypothetical protein [Caudoviricetes sp.]
MLADATFLRYTVIAVFCTRAIIRRAEKYILERRICWI